MCLLVSSWYGLVDIIHDVTKDAVVIISELASVHLVVLARRSDGPRYSLHRDRAAINMLFAVIENHFSV